MVNSSLVREGVSYNTVSTDINEDFRLQAFGMLLSVDLSAK